MTIDQSLPDYSRNILILMTMSYPVSCKEKGEVERDYAKLFPLDSDMPPLEEIEHLLQRDGANPFIRVENIVSEWYAMKIHRTPAYRIVKHLGPTFHPPDEEAIHTATTELLAHLEAEGDAVVFALEELHLKNVLPEDVFHAWTICRMHGITPFIARERIISNSAPRPPANDTLLFG